METVDTYSQVLSTIHREAIKKLGDVLCLRSIFRESLPPERKGSVHCAVTPSSLGLFCIVA